MVSALRQLGRVRQAVCSRAMVDHFPSGSRKVVRALSALPCNAVLDAELIVPDARERSAFERLRRRNLLERSALIEHAAAAEPAVPLCFDLLAWMAMTCSRGAYGLAVTG